MLRQASLALILGSLSLGLLAQDSDCTYDQPHQIAVLQEIASRHADAVISEATRTVSWNRDDETKLSVQFGGCYHLGFTVSAIRQRDVASSEEETFRMAMALAREFWDEADSKSLETAIISHRYTEERTPNGMLYHLQHESYDECVVERELVEGRERVTIRWLRSY